MLKTIQQWWSGSWLVHKLEGLALVLAAAWQDSWFGRFLAQPWDDSAPQFQASGVQRVWHGLAIGRQRLARSVQCWLSTSYCLGRWPDWLASDLAWVWHGSLLSRLLGLLDENTVSTDAPEAPPRWRLLLYFLAASLLAGAALLLPQGMTLLKWAVLAVALALVWARPRTSVVVIVFLLPILPILSTTLLIFAAFAARLCQAEPFYPRASWIRTLGGLFCLVGLAAALASEDMLAALRYWRYYLAAYLFLILLLDTLRTPREIGQVLSCGLLGVALVALLSIWQYLGGMPINLSWVDIRVSAVMTRVVGTFDNPNMLAGYLVAWLPFPVSWFLAKESSLRQRLVGFLLAGLLGVSLILTFSRGGWLAFAAALFIIVVCLEPRLLWAVPVLLLVAPFVLPPVIWQRLASIVNLEDTSNMVRLYVWDSSLKMFLANWFLGIGQGLVPFARVYPVFQYGVVPALHAHSLILQLAVESGFISLFLFLWLCIALWRLAMRNWQAAPQWAVPLGAALVGHLVHGIFDYTWYDLRVMLVFWLLVALACAVARWRLKEAK